MKDSNTDRQIFWTLLYVLVAPFVAMMGYSWLVKHLLSEGYIDPTPTVITAATILMVLIVTAPIIAIMTKFDNQD